MNEVIERIGICVSRGIKMPGLFHRIKLKLSRKFRVWPIPGDDRSQLLDPSEFADRFEVVEEHTPAPSKRCEGLCVEAILRGQATGQVIDGHPVCSFCLAAMILYVRDRRSGWEMLKDRIPEAIPLEN